MTSLAAWPGVDSRGLSTLYIVADSRISWPGSSDHCEVGVKVFASSFTPDIFGFYGDVLVPSMVLPRLVEGPLLNPLSGPQERHDELAKVLRHSSEALPVARRGAFGVLHGGRNGEGMKSTRYLWHTHWSPKQGWSDHRVEIDKVSALTIALGSGDRVVTNHQIAARSELGTFSRAVYTGFCDSLISGEDPFSGGAPQLVGLYRNGSGMHFGIIMRGGRYYRGLGAEELSVPQIEWRNELFERCDSFGKRIESAQAQPRLRVSETRF
jgi:hypothetical protein